MKQSKETIAKRINSRKLGKGWKIGSGKKAWETRRKRGNDKGFKNPKIWITRRKNNPDNKASQKASETKKINGTNKAHFVGTTESVKKGWLTRRKNGNDRGYKHPGHSASGKRNIRIAKLNYIARQRYSSEGTIGKNEAHLLDLQEQTNNCKIQRQFNTGIGYLADGYCSETNTVYEVYEKKHDRQVFKDLERENEICKHLGCDFVIIWDYTK